MAARRGVGAAHVGHALFGNLRLLPGALAPRPRRFAVLTQPAIRRPAPQDAAAALLLPVGLTWSLALCSTSPSCVDTLSAVSTSRPPSDGRRSTAGAHRALRHSSDPRGRSVGARFREGAGASPRRQQAINKRFGKHVRGVNAVDRSAGWSASPRAKQY